MASSPRDPAGPDPSDGPATDDTPGPGRLWRFGGRPGLALSLALGVAGGLLLAQIVTALFARLRGLLTIVVVSLFLALAVEPAVQWLHRRGLRRGLGTALVFLTGLLLVAGFVAAMLPLIVTQARSLAAAAPSLLRDLAQLAERLPGELGVAFSDWIEQQRQGLPQVLGRPEGIGRGILDLGQTIVGTFFQLATIGLVTFYLAADGPRFRMRLASRLAPRTQVRVLGILELAISKVGGYVYSRVLTAVASAVFHIVVFSLVGLDYAVALGVWVGLISSLIPVIGTYLAGALPVVVALASSVGQTIWVLVAIVVYQQLENYWIAPRITASTLQLHPVVAFLSVIGGATLAGVPGALLAIPAVAIVTAVVGAATAEYDVLEHSLLETGPPGAVKLLGEMEWPPAAPPSEPDPPAASERDRPVAP